MTIVASTSIPEFNPVTKGIVHQARMEVMRCLAAWISIESITHIIIAITSVTYLNSSTAIIVMITVLTMINGIFSYIAFHKSHLLNKLVKYIKLSRQYEKNKTECINQLENNHVKTE